MGESKSSVYDDDETAPLVPVEPVAGDVPLLNAVPGTDSVFAAASTIPVDEPTVATNVSEVPMSHEEYLQQQLVGAGVASGVLGMLLGGPILAMLLGFGATYACEKPGAAGDTARAVGDVALSVRDKAREVDAKHHLVLRAQTTAAEAWSKAKELDQRHNILERAKEFAAHSFRVTVDFVRRHRLIERGVESVGKAVYWAADRVAEKLNQNRTPAVSQEVD